MDADSLPRLRLLEQERLGGGTGAHDFRRVGGVQVDAQGRLYVYEASVRAIRVFAPGGEHLHDIGRAGAGPGQFQDTGLSFGITADTLWAVDTLTRRITYFDLSGRLLATASFPEMRFQMHSADMMRWLVPVERGADGLFVGDVGGGFAIRMSANPARPDSSIQIPRVRFDARGAVVDTAGSYTSWFSSAATAVLEVGRSNYAVPAPLSDVPLQVPEPDGLVTVTRPTPAAGESSFRVTRTDLAGDTVQDVTFRYRAERYKPNVLDSLAFRAARAPGGSYGTMTWEGNVSIRRAPEDSAAARPLIREALRFPEYQPPVQGSWRAQDGSLWLQREDTEAETVRWILLDPELRPRGELALPRGFRPLWGGGDQIWVLEVDEAGVTRLVRYRVGGPLSE